MLSLSLYTAASSAAPSPASRLESVAACVVSPPKTWASSPRLSLPAQPAQLASSVSRGMRVAMFNSNARRGIAASRVRLVNYREVPLSPCGMKTRFDATYALPSQLIQRGREPHS